MITHATAMALFEQAGGSQVDFPTRLALMRSRVSSNISIAALYRQRTTNMPVAVEYVPNIVEELTANGFTVNVSDVPNNGTVSMQILNVSW
jgi:hypothetical protein